MDEREMLALALEGQFGADSRSQNGGGYLGVQGPDGWHGGIGGNGWRESTPEWSGGKTNITDINIGKRIGDLDVTGSYSSSPRATAQPMDGGNMHFDPIDRPDQRIAAPRGIDNRYMLRLRKEF
jgi:hypothetical protein